MDVTTPAVNESEQRKQAAREIGELVFQLLANCQQKEEKLAEQFQMSVPEFRCLRSFRGDDEVTIKTLTERLALSGSRLTRIVDELENKGLVTRAFHQEDRRSILVILTKRGATIAKQLENRYIQIHEEILTEFPMQQQEVLSDGLRQLLRSLEKWLHQTG